MCQSVESHIGGTWKVNSTYKESQRATVKLEIKFLNHVIRRMNIRSSDVGRHTKRISYLSPKAHDELSASDLDGMIS